MPDRRRRIPPRVPPRCYTGKVRHRTLLDAMLHVMQLKRKDNETRDRGELVAYWCEACGGWHCGHKRTRAWSA